MAVRLATLLLLSFPLVAPLAAADVGVRTCDTPTFCHDLVVVETSLVECYVDLLKNGLGKPPTVRLSCPLA